MTPSPSTVATKPWAVVIRTSITRAMELPVITTSFTDISSTSVSPSRRSAVRSVVRSSMTPSPSRIFSSSG